MRRLFRLGCAALALAAATVSCRGCQTDGPASLLDLAAVDASAAVWVPDLAQLTAGIEAFASHATRKAGAGALRRVRDSLAKQLAFDPFVRDEFAKVGINPGGGLLLWVEAGSREPLVAMAVADAARFDSALTELVARTDGADKVTDSPHAGRTVHSAGRPFGTTVAAALHWVHVGKYVLIARPDGLADLDRTLTRWQQGSAAGASSNTASIVADPVYKSLKDKVPVGDALLFVRGGTDRPGAPAAAAGWIGSTASCKINNDGISADSFSATRNGAALQAAFGSEPPLPLAGQIDNDAVALLLSRALQPAGIKALRAEPALAPLLDRALMPLGRAIGANVENDVLPLLAGPVTLSVHVGNANNLLQRAKDVHSLDQALDAVHVAVTAELRDAPQMLAALRTARASLAKQNIVIRERTAAVGGTQAVIFEPDRDHPKLGWAVWGKTYVYGAGPGRLEQILRRLAQGPSDLPTTLTKSVGGTLASKPGTTLIVRGRALADATSNLQPTGDSAGARMGIGALISGALDLLRTLGDAVVGVSADAEGLRLQLRETLQ